MARPGVMPIASMDDVEFRRWQHCRGRYRAVIAYTICLLAWLLVMMTCHSAQQLGASTAGFVGAAAALYIAVFKEALFCNWQNVICSLTVGNMITWVLFLTQTDTLETGAHTNSSWTLNQLLLSNKLLGHAFVISALPFSFKEHMGANLLALAMLSSQLPSLCIKFTADPSDKQRYIQLAKVFSDAAQVYNG